VGQGVMAIGGLILGWLRFVQNWLRLGVLGRFEHPPRQEYWVRLGSFGGRMARLWGRSAGASVKWG
jgi:hypothetical protein